MANKVEPKVFKLKELAEYLNLTPLTIYRRVREGKIPAVRIGKTWRFPKEIIDDWLKKKAKEPINRKLFKVGREVGVREKIKFKSYPGKVKGKLTRKEIYDER